MRLLFIYVLFLSSNAWAAVPATSVIVEPVQELAVGEPMTFNAIIRSRDDIELPTSVEGELLWVLAEGERVQKGQVVARVDNAALQLRLEEQQLLAERAAINARYLQGEVGRVSTLQEAHLAARTQLAELVSRRDLAINDERVAKSRIAQLQEQFDRTEVISPVDGMVVERLKQGGEFARRGESIVRLVNPTALELLVSIPIVYLNRLDSGLPIKVAVNGVAFEAPPRAVLRTGQVDSQTFRLVMDVPPLVTPLVVGGQFANATVAISEHRNSLFVPRDAVVLRTDGSFVFRINADNTAQRVGVQLGAGQGELVSVTGDLSAGDQVAVRGVENLTDGQPVLPTS